jgi:hypothetical protein
VNKRVWDQSIDRCLGISRVELPSRIAGWRGLKHGP